METAGLGMALPGRPVLLAPRPPGRALRPSPRRKGTSPSGGNGASWPQGGWRGPRGGLKCVLPPTGIPLPERPLFTVTHLPAPFSVPSLRSCSGDGAGGSMGHFPPHPSPRTSQQCLATCLVGGDTGPCSRHSAPILGSLLHLPLVPSPDVCAVTFTRMPACRCWVRFGQATPGLGGSEEGRAYLTACQNFCCGCCSAVASSTFHTIADYTMPNPQAQNLPGASSNLPLCPASLSALT